MKKKVTEGNQFVTIDENTDFRFLKPLDAKEIAFIGINEESNRKLVEEAKIDDRRPDYRDALVDAILNEYNKYLDRYECETERQYDNICAGASTQLSKANNELVILNELRFDNINF